MLRHRSWLLYALMLLPPLALYLRGFDGFWLGDDFSNLHQAHATAEAGRHLDEWIRVLTESVSAGAAFWRPGIVWSFGVDHALWGERYAGWFAQNLSLHLANGVLLALLLRRGCGDVANRDVAAALAGALFLLMPWGAEAVYWVSARSDLWVTLFGLLALHGWLRGGALARVALPLGTLGGLLFKESALVLPAVAFALWVFRWPSTIDTHSRVAQRDAVLLAGFVAIAWLVAKNTLFGSALATYGGDAMPMPLAALAWVQGIDEWWRGGWAAHPDVALGALLATGALLLAALRDAGASRRLALGAMLATAGTVLATALGTGAWPSNGEGGRLLYTAEAWLVLALAPAFFGHGRARSAALALGIALAALQAGLLAGRWSEVARTQTVIASAAAWMATTPSSGVPWLLVLPDHIGPVVALRNGQGGLVLPPVQASDRMIVAIGTLPGELEGRHALLRDGFIAHLQARGGWAPALLDAAPTTGLEPRGLACWSWPAQRIVTIAPAPPALGDTDAATWAAQVRVQLERAGCAGVVDPPPP